MGTVYNKNGGGGGGAKVIYLGTGASFNVSNYSGYRNFTKDNFIVEPPKGNHDASGNGNSFGFQYSKSYNSSTGVFSLAMRTYTYTPMTVVATKDVSSSCKVWLAPNGVE